MRSDSRQATLAKMTTSEADEKPKAFQEACAEDSKPKFARQGKNFKAAAIVKPKQKLKANFWVCFFCKLQILKDVQSKSSPRSYSAKLKQSDVSSD